MTRAELTDRIDGDARDAARRRRQPRACTSADEVLAAATEPLGTRNIIVVEEGRYPRARAQRASLLRARRSRTCCRPQRTRGALMLDATSKALFHGLAQVPPAATAGFAVRHGARAGFARRFIAGETIEEAIDARPDSAGAKGLRLTLDYLGESVATLGADAAAAADYVAIIEHDRRLGHRAQHLAQADAARPRRRPGHRGRQHAAHPRAGRRARVLRAHRHGELALHRRHARHPRDAVAAGAPPRSARSIQSCLKRIARRHPPPERARRARAAGEGRLQGAEDRRVPEARPKWTRRSST